MVEEFLHIRVWDASPLRTVVDRLSLASISMTLLVFPSAGDRTNSASFDGEVDASDGTWSSASSGMPDEVTTLLESKVWDELNC
jgi:hypothetical protein